MGRSRIRISTNTNQRPVTPLVELSTVNAVDVDNLKRDYFKGRPSSSLYSRIYLPKEAMLMAALFPVAEILYHWDQLFYNRPIIPVVFKLFVALVVSLTSAAIAATAVWWPRHFKGKVEIDTKGSRMGLLFCVFGAQVAQGTFQALPQVWGRRLVTLTALVATVVWERLTQSWHYREIFLIGCFLSGASIPTYLYISKSILLELFTSEWVNLVFFMYTVITLIGVVVYRPTPIFASRYLLALLLTVPNSYS